MSWAGIANNQTISNENLQDAITTGVFSAGVTPIPLTPPDNKKQGTKSLITSYITIPNTSYAPYANKSDNQLLVKSDIPSQGDFILDPLPSYYQIDNLVCIGAPSFSFPVTAGNTTLPYNGTIPSQSISVTITYIGIDFPPIFSDINVSLYVNSVLIDSQSVSVYGGSVNVYLPNDISAPNEIRISIGSGVPPGPGPFSFIGVPVNNVAVSKSTGQYMIASVGKWNFTTSNFLRLAVDGGPLCYSIDYGATWYKSNTIGTFSKLAISDDGAYALALSQNGAVYRSTNYGVTWTATGLTGIGSGADISAVGDTMYVCSRIIYPLGRGTVYKSIDYGASWTEVTPPATAGVTRDFSGIAFDGSTVTVGLFFISGGGPPAYYLSLNGGSSWSLQSVTYP